MFASANYIDVICIQGEQDIHYVDILRKQYTHKNVVSKESKIMICIC